jgi:hypothetical protein
MLRALLTALKLRMFTTVRGAVNINYWWIPHA